ncbi:MAG: hypothetical protein ACI9Y1_003646 [Lentisphaeria bacterium]|jgi:hypothetical protein
MSIRIAGAGYGRTGTKHLQQTLEILGHGPYYHIDTIRYNPQDLHLWTSVFPLKDAMVNTLHQVSSFNRHHAHILTFSKECYM